MTRPPSFYNVWLPRVSTEASKLGEPATYRNNLALVKSSMAMLQYFYAFGPQIQRLRTEAGTVSAIAGIFKAPFDILADKLRGYIGLTLDMAPRSFRIGNYPDRHGSIRAPGRQTLAILKTSQEKVGRLLDAGKVSEAEAQLDRVLDGLGVEPNAGPEPTKPGAPKAKADAPSTQLVEAAHKRLTEKIRRVKEGMQKWADSGRDPPAVSQAMHEKFKPLLDAGKFIKWSNGGNDPSRLDPCYGRP